MAIADCRAQSATSGVHSAESQCSAEFLALVLTECERDTVHDSAPAPTLPAMRPAALSLTLVALAMPLRAQGSALSDLTNTLRGEVAKIAARQVPAGVMCPAEPPVPRAPACKRQYDGESGAELAGCYEPLLVEQDGWQSTAYVCCTCGSDAQGFSQACGDWQAYQRTADVYTAWEQNACLLVWRSSTGRFRTASHPADRIGGAPNRVAARPAP